MVQPANNIVTTSHVSDTQGSEPSETMYYDAYFDFDNLNFLFQKNEPPSFDLSNEHDSAFDQAYSDEMVSVSILTLFMLQYYYLFIYICQDGRFFKNK